MRTSGRTEIVARPMVVATMASRTSILVATSATATAGEVLGRRADAASGCPRLAKVSLAVVLGVAAFGLGRGVLAMLPSDV